MVEKGQQQHHEIYLTFTAGSVSLCGVCSYLVVGKVVVVTYVDAVVAVTVMRDYYLCCMCVC